VNVISPKDVTEIIINMVSGVTSVSIQREYLKTPEDEYEDDDEDE
jgi:hypothetical protein